MPSKRFRKASELVDASAAYPLERAVEVLKRFPPAKFNETVEITASLNIDPKKTDQVVRGTVVLPHGLGRTPRILAFCKGEQELQARSAGADHIGGAELIQKVLDGWLEFDAVVATPEMMRDVSKLGKILGPRGLMPTPRTGTVTPDIAKAIDEIKRGKVEFKMDKTANLHFVIGKLAFTPEQLVENGRTALQAIVRAKPASLKGRLIRRISLSSTMSPGIPLASDELEADFAEAA